MTASWVIRERRTGRVICETFDRRTVDTLPAQCVAVPIGEYLASLNTPQGWCEFCGSGPECCVCGRGRDNPLLDEVMK